MTPNEFLDKLDQAEQQLTHGSFKEPLEECLEIIQDGFDENFRKAEDEDGVPWPPRKDNYPHPLLVLSGDLHSAATRRGASGNVSNVGDRELEAGVNESVIPYAGKHQRGGGNTPPRQYLYASEETLDKCDQTITNWVIENIF